jgi:hypothetical protein
MTTVVVDDIVDHIQKKKKQKVTAVEVVKLLFIDTVF